MLLTLIWCRYINKIWKVNWHLLFYCRFPDKNKEPGRYKEWVRNCRRDKPLGSSAVICSHHFKAGYLDHTRQTIRLREGAVPTIFVLPPHLIKLGSKMRTNLLEWSMKSDELSRLLIGDLCQKSDPIFWIIKIIQKWWQISDVQILHFLKPYSYRLQRNSALQELLHGTLQQFFWTIAYLYFFFSSISKCSVLYKRSIHLNGKYFTSMVRWGATKTNQF